MFKKKILILIVYSLLICPSLSINQVYIHTTVNEKIITNLDIVNEIKYLKILNPKLTELNKDEIFKIGKTSLINEIIKKDEIEKFINFVKENILVNDFLVNLYTKLNFSNENDFENFLQENGIYSLNEIKKKLKIEILWNELVFLKFGKQVKIDKNSFLNKLKDFENKKKTEFLLSEIVFNKEKNQDLNFKKNKIQSSISEIGFKNTANIYSISDTSKLGGDIGWVSENNLSNEIFKNLKDLNEGDYTNPIQIGNNFLILRIEKKRLQNISINKEDELNKMIKFETNKQLNQFSRIFFNKSKLNYSINEK